MADAELIFALEAILGEIQQVAETLALLHHTLEDIADSLVEQKVPS